MPRCPACAGDIREPAALRCPYCGAALAETLTRTADDGAAGFHIRPIDGARLAPGRILGSRYRVVSFLGHGSGGEVYRAEDLRLGVPVALKLLSADGAHAREGLVRLASEVLLARGIAHPNVCRVYDIGEADGWHYLSMEYVDGETLASLHHRIGRLPDEKALDVARQLCAGLAAAHEHGVLHRDLKPSNIMLDGRGRVRILDFGLAIRSGEREIREIAGTPAYMAPEQLSGEPITERTDMYALGLVLYELFAGRPVFAARTFADRLHAGALATLDVTGRMLDARIVETIRSCLALDPGGRPSSALSVAAALPLGDSIAAALAEGRVPPPDMVAAATPDGGLRPAVAWSLLAAAVAVTLAVASRAEVLTVAPSELPKPLEVLAERSRQILAGVGAVSTPLDREYWIDTATGGAGAASLRFVYRQSSQLLVPQNLFHVVTESDPALNAQGMAIVTLDPAGRLRGFSRIPDLPGVEGRPVSMWSDLFGAAGLDLAEFTQVFPADRPLVKHDTVIGWTRGAAAVPSTTVLAAALDGNPVHFEIDPASTLRPARVPITTYRSPLAETALWAVVVVVFATAIVMASRNLRAGEGDLAGARVLAIVMFCGGFLSLILRAHHLPDPLDEVILVLSTSGWSFVWASFSWLAYVSFEPHVRRLWPHTLVSWTRMLSGRVRDSLIGRDVLIGVLTGTIIAAALLLRVEFSDGARPEYLSAPALEALRSSRHFASRILYAALDGLQFSLGAFYMLLLLRLILRRTWIAVLALLVLGAAINGNVSSPWPVIYALSTGALFVTLVLKFGLLAGVVTVMCERLLTRLPITLDPGAWYFGSSMAVVLLVLAAAVCGFTLAQARRPAPSGRAAGFDLRPS
jgi:serine/threonine-protein kinase